MLAAQQKQPTNLNHILVPPQVHPAETQNIDIDIKLLDENWLERMGEWLDERDLPIDFVEIKKEDLPPSLRVVQGLKNPDLKEEV
jgi:hypothetical protein